MATVNELKNDNEKVPDELIFPSVSLVCFLPNRTFSE